MTHYVIVGNGVAGLRAAEVIRKRDGEGKTTLLSDELHPFYYRPQLADYVGGLIEESSLWARSQGFFAQQQIPPCRGRGWWGLTQRGGRSSWRTGARLIRNSRSWPLEVTLSCRPGRVAVRRGSLPSGP